jgi:hypothetical protein
VIYHSSNLSKSSPGLSLSEVIQKILLNNSFGQQKCFHGHKLSSSFQSITHLLFLISFYCRANEFVDEGFTFFLKYQFPIRRRLDRIHSQKAYWHCNSNKPQANEFYSLHSNWEILFNAIRSFFNPSVFYF